MAISNIVLSLDESNNGPVLGSRRQVRAGLYDIFNYVHNNRETILKRINETHKDPDGLTDNQKLGMYLGYMLDDLLEGIAAVAPHISNFDELYKYVKQWEAQELVEAEKYGIANY